MVKKFWLSSCDMLADKTTRYTPPLSVTASTGPIISEIGMSCLVCVSTPVKVIVAPATFQSTNEIIVPIK
jgi:hypothetical protein